jgi:hypothetical protein
MNCHPATDRPLQGNDKHPHQPVATRETPCITCHTNRNFTLHERASYRSIPGHPRWMTAPIEMAWEGKSIGEICRQIKDPNRNGGHWKRIEPWRAWASRSRTGLRHRNGRICDGYGPRHRRS